MAPLPTVSAQSPAPDALNVVQNTDVFFHIGGADGVGLASLDVDVQIDSGAFVPVVVAGVVQFPYDGGNSAVAAQGDGFDVTSDYRGRFPALVPITVRVNAENNSAEAMAEVLYSFTTNSSKPAGIELLQIATG